MTKILIDRAVVEQALEAMRCAVPTGKITLYAWDKAMAALRAALAEPQPLYGWVFKRNADGTVGIFAPPPRPGESQRTSDCVGPGQRDLHELLGKLADHMAALAEPVQEPDSPERRCGGPGCDMRCCQPVQEPKPVAWLYRGNLHPFDPSDWASDPATPLYAHPPQRPAEPVQEPAKQCMAHGECFGGECIYQRPAEPVHPAIPLENSREAADAIEATLAEYGHPTNPVNAARAGWRAARLYAAPQQRNPVGWDGRCMLGHCNSPAGCENSGECRAVERAHGIGGEG